MYAYILSIYSYTNTLIHVYTSTHILIYGCVQEAGDWLKEVLYARTHPRICVWVYRKRGDRLQEVLKSVEERLHEKAEVPKLIKHSH